jgi:hypothetical protein
MMPVEKTFDLTGRHLVIGMPAYGGMFPDEFQNALIETLLVCRKHGVTVTTASRCGSALIDKTRDEIFHSFLTRTNGTDLLMIDSDIVWTPDDVMRLLGWTTDKEFVIGPYCTKEDNPAFFYDLVPSDTGKLIQDENGLIAVKSAPGGFNMMRRSVIEKMVAGYPELVYRAKRGEFKDEDLSALSMMYLEDKPDGTRLRIGEDIAFCNR